MDAAALIDALESFPPCLRAVVDGLDASSARWRPDERSWSIVEIVRHLGDEEVEDFRTRVRLTLEDPTREWPPTDPEGWATARDYRAADLEEALEGFVIERAVSIEWLRSLSNPPWSNARVHPRFGPLPAGMLLASWAAHDMLHLRQIAKRRYGLVERDAGEYGTRYAGDW